MGSLYKSIFGGEDSKNQSTSQSSNQAYPYIQGAYSGQVGNGTAANSQISSLLGLTDPSQASAAFNDYKNSAGYNSTLQAGSQAITDNAASRGLLSSGATAKGLDQFGQQTNQQYYNSYLQNLLGLSTAGTQAGGLIAGAGQQSSSQSTASSDKKNGISGLLGTIMGGAPKG